MLFNKINLSSSDLSPTPGLWVLVPFSGGGGGGRFFVSFYVLRNQAISETIITLNQLRNKVPKPT